MALMYNAFNINLHKLNLEFYEVKLEFREHLTNTFAEVRKS